MRQVPVVSVNVFMGSYNYIYEKTVYEANKVISLLVYYSNSYFISMCFVLFRLLIRFVTFRFVSFLVLMGP